MKQTRQRETILAIISPTRIHLYNFNKLQLPKVNSRKHLIIISDRIGFMEHLPPHIQEITKVVNLVNYNEQVKFFSLDEIKLIIEELLEKGNSIRIVSDEEMFLDDVAKLNKKYNLVGFKPDHIDIFRDKYFMKIELENKCMSNEVLKIPFFYKLNKQQNLPNISFPIICKPLNLAGSIGVRKCDSILELKSYLDNTNDSIICEEYIEGNLIHCDALVQSNKILYLNSAKYFEPMDKATKKSKFIGSEIICNKETKQQLLKIIKLIVNSYDIPDGMIHIELLEKNNKFYFVEIGVRPAGAWISRMYDKAFGINIFNHHIEVNYMIPSYFENAIINKYVMGLHFLVQKSGTITSIISPEIEYNNFNYYVVNSKLNNYQYKTNSMLDWVCEYIIFDNSKEKYLETFNLAKSTNVIFK